MQKSVYKHSAGFTLVEILLYLSLTTVLVLLMGAIGTSIMSGYVKVQAAEEMHYTSQFVTETIRRLVSQSEYIISPLAGESSETLSLGTSDGTASPTIIDVVDGRVRVQVGDTAAQFISGEGILVALAEFSNVTYGDSAGSVGLRVVLEQRTPEYQSGYLASTTLSTTINLQYP